MTNMGDKLQAEAKKTFTAGQPDFLELTADQIKPDSNIDRRIKVWPC